MASSTTASRLVAILLWLLVLSISATARPCRTFFISYYSVSFRHPSYAETLTTFNDIRSLLPVRIVGNDINYDNPSFSAKMIFNDALLDHLLEEEEEHEAENELRASEIRVPFGFSSHDFSSFRDRTKDIMSVVLALLFGVGCGALTAVVLYMVWALFSNHYDYRDSYDDYVDDDEEIESPKKMGYVKTPPVESVPAPDKEAV